MIIEFNLNILNICYFLVTHRTGQISELSFWVHFTLNVLNYGAISAHKSSIKYVTVVMSKSTLNYVLLKRNIYYTTNRSFYYSTIAFNFIFLGEKFIRFTLQYYYIHPVSVFF